MDATNPALASVPAKHTTTSTLVRFVGGGVLAAVHGFVVYEAGKFIFLEYIARLSDKYVWITQEPHWILEPVVMIGILGMLSAIIPLASWRRSVRWLLLSFALVIFEVPLPIFFSNQNSLYLYRSLNGVGAGEDVLNNFYKENRRYPASQRELDAFVPGQKWFLRFSWYAHRGVRLPYHYVYVPNASGPYGPNPPGPDPATVYCAVSGDLQHYWSTATYLRGPIGNEIDMASDKDGLIVFEGSAGKNSLSRE